MKSKLLLLSGILLPTLVSNAALSVVIASDMSGNAIVGVEASGLTDPTATGSWADGTVSFINVASGMFGAAFNGFSASSSYGSQDFYTESTGVGVEIGGTTFLLNRFEFENDPDTGGDDDDWSMGFGTPDKSTGTGLPFTGGAAPIVGSTNTFTRILDTALNPVSFSHFNEGSYFDTGDADNGYFGGITLVIDADAILNNPIPEPSSTLLSLIAGSFMLARRRRK